MTGGFDDIIDSVAKDFFGSSDDFYKELVKNSNLDALEEALQKDSGTPVSDDIKKTADILAKRLAGRPPSRRTVLVYTACVR